MPRPVIIMVYNGNGLDHKRYREVLRTIWKLCGKFGFEAHGFSSVFVGNTANLEMFLTFLEAQGLKYHVEVVR